MHMDLRTLKISLWSNRSQNGSGLRSSERWTNWSLAGLPSGSGSRTLPALGMSVMRQTMRMRRVTLASAAVALAITGCGGGKDFANKPRPPVPLQLTGVITKAKVTISPNKVGAGPVVITVSNQTQQSRTLTLDGNGIQERVGPINPLDTATLQKTLKPGRYTVTAGSDVATNKTVQPATL